ncbi:MAG TPA: ABC transporter permease [Puia sp.]|nr:ABC transporter permease [Puia sp.]
MVRARSQVFNQDVLYEDNNSFGVFSFPLTQGTRKTVLADINSVVITHESAEKYFGTTNAVGKIVEIQNPVRSLRTE